MKIIINGKEVDEGTIIVDGFHPSDYPDCPDAYIEGAEFVDGTKLTEDECEQLQDNYFELFYELVTDKVCASYEPRYPD